MKLIIILCRSNFCLRFIYYIYIILIEHSNLYAIFFQSFFPRFHFCPIYQIFTSNLILNNIQNRLIKFWCRYRFLTTKTSFTFGRSWRISRHIAIISNICHTIIIWFFIPYSCFIIYIIKIFSINSSKFIPKILSISLSHPIWRLYTILTICSIQKSSYFITRYGIFIWKWSNIQTNLRQSFCKSFSIYKSNISQHRCKR